MATLELVPVHTRILTDKDDIVEAIAHYAGDKIGPEDIVCVAESVVAITQGHFTRPEELKPTWQARFLCRFVPAEGSMSSVYGMQAAMELEGKWKVMAAFFAGAIAKIFRNKFTPSKNCYDHVYNRHRNRDTNSRIPQERQAFRKIDVFGRFFLIANVFPDQPAQCIAEVSRMP